MVALLLGGGAFFLIVSRAMPYRYLGHAFAVMSGRYDTPTRRGAVALPGACRRALQYHGLGNIAGVALAIVAGGPGAVFWMWMSAVVGIAKVLYLLAGCYVSRAG